MDPLVSALRFLQADDSNHQSNGVHPWGDLQRKLRSAGLNIKYKTFKARWDSQQPDDAILHDLVDRFDGHGVVLKTNNPQLAQGDKSKKSSIDTMAKRATKLGK